MTDSTDDGDKPSREELENRVAQLEQTVSQMLPSRRDALKLGGTALAAGATGMAISGSASAGSQSVGTVGTSSDPVDIEAGDISADAINADEITSTTPRIKHVEGDIADDDQETLFSLGLSQNLFSVVLIDSDSGIDDNAAIITNRGGAVGLLEGGIMNVLSGNNDLTGTSGPDGNINISRFFGQTRIENRSGSSITVEVVEYGSKRG